MPHYENHQILLSVFKGKKMSHVLKLSKIHSYLVWLVRHPYINKNLV